MKKTTIHRLILLVNVLFASTILQAYDETVDHLLEGTLMYSGLESKAVLAFDDNASTYYSTSADKMQWVGLDLGEPYVITRVGYTPAPGYQGADRMLLSLFEGANSPDFMDALPLHLISQKPANGTATTADVNVSRGFRYVRYVGGAGSYCNIAELEFYGHAGVGDDSQFYQITNLPTLSIHVQDNILPVNRGEDFESQSVLIYEDGTMIQEYPILFRVRGNYSATHENKAFRFKYNDGKSHHIMKDGKNESPVKAKKWVLINSYRDKTLMRNPVAWAMSKRAEMQWTPWSQVVDLVVNGDYHGTYTFADHVDVHSGRIDITDMIENDIDEETITGGYYVEVDNNASREPYWFNSSHGNPISIHEPDEDIIQPEQYQYIKDTWNNMENVVFSSDYTDPEKGLRSVVDTETFLRYFLTSEFNGNTDMLCQVFLYKERGDDHFYTGPVWDADLALENDQTTYPANERMDWTYKVRDTGNWTQFVGRVLSDPTVFADLQEMWAKLRKKGAFEPKDLAADVDSIRAEVRASANLNFIRWPYLNQWLSLNPAVPGSWEAEVDRVRDYVYNRVAWMDEMLSYGKVHQENGIYQIASGMDLATFSQMVNEGGVTDAQAVLVSDIDMEEYNESFQPIGTTRSVFSGSLDGQGHTIRNLHITGTDAALFSHVSDCSFSNIIFDESCSVEGPSRVGMLVGYTRKGNLTISGIENHGSVTSAGRLAGAIVGYAAASATVSISNCSNTGSISARSNAAALVGPSDGSVTVENSYNIGTITGATEGKDFASSTSSLTISNCWDYTSTQTRHMTPEQVASGYLCFEINGNAGDIIWRQNLDNGRQPDPYPVLRKSAGRVFEDADDRYSNYNPHATGYRYYNLVVTRLRDGSCIQFSEFDILDASLNEVEDLNIYGGTESNIPHENWPNVADNNVDTKYCNAVYNGYAYFLFDATSEVAPSAYRIYTANDTGNLPERNPVSWQLYGSNTQLFDPADPEWVLIDEHENDFSLPMANFKPTDFYIIEPPTTITLANRSAILVSGEQLQLEATLTPTSMEGAPLRWTSSDETVATVDERGRIVATGMGKATITVSAQEDRFLRDSCMVTVVRERPQYRYFQFAVDEIQGSSAIQLSEIALFDQKGQEVSPISLYSSTGSYYSDEVQENLFDGNISTKYCGPYSSGTTLYLFVDAGRPVTLSGYQFTTANDTKDNPGRNPLSWSLLGSNEQTQIPDDEAWTLLDRRENDYTLGAVNYRPYDFSLSQGQPVIIMAQSYVREYGEPNPTFQFTSEGAPLDGVPAILCDATATSPAGQYPIVLEKGSVKNSLDAYVNGVLTITKAPLTVSANNASMEQGAELPALTLTFSGWKNGEDESVLSEQPVATTEATSQSTTGDYPIVVTGGQAANYDFLYVEGVLTVTEPDAIDMVRSTDEDEVFYNLQGVRVGRNYKGIVVVKGKKIRR